MFCNAGGGFGALENGGAADYIEVDKKGLAKAVADRAARWVEGT